MRYITRLLETTRLTPYPLSLLHTSLSTFNSRRIVNRRSISCQLTLHPQRVRRYHSVPNDPGSRHTSPPRVRFALTNASRNKLSAQFNSFQPSNYFSKPLPTLKMSATRLPATANKRPLLFWSAVGVVGAGAYAIAQVRILPRHE